MSKNRVLFVFEAQLFPSYKDGTPENRRLGSYMYLKPSCQVWSKYLEKNGYQNFLNPGKNLETKMRKHLCQKFTNQIKCIYIFW